MLGDTVSLPPPKSNSLPPETVQDGIALSSYEAAAYAKIITAVGDLARLVHIERRSSDYLTFVLPEHGRDFCRLKASARALWMSLDFYPLQVPSNDPRIISVENKKQRHWKFPLSIMDAIDDYADLILLSAQAAYELRHLYENRV